MSPRHALFVDGAYVDLEVGYEWPMPKARRVGTTQHTPYGPPWDDGTDESGNAVFRAEPGTVTLHVGGTTATDAANRAETWTAQMLRATRLRDNTTGRFLELLLVRGLGERDPVRGTGYTLTFEVEYLNPYWHDAAGDGSTRLHP